VRVTFATEPAPAKANEDFVAATATAVVVLDGATVPGDLGLGCHHGTAWFVQRLGARLLWLLTVHPGRPMADALAMAIEDTGALHADTCQLDHPGTPSTTVAAVRERGDMIDYLVLADSTVLLDGLAGVQVITDDRIQGVALAEHAAARRHPIGSPASRQEFSALASELRRYRNRAGGFWVASVHPEAAQHAVSGSVPRADLTRLAVLTDGATRLADGFKLVAWSDVLGLLANDGPEELIRRTRQAEAADPEGVKWPRSKQYDDATAVFCRL
jgi:hypothetical protein